ncbi:hypothetical protein [Amycolatopsis sp. NPDC004625]|uniref:hypothetical protein n=1 Tax=Amycolatopsis sp. NPDC004625 TaxID=3154670 RepID=UPI0033AD894D
MAARNESRQNPAETAERQVRAYELALRGLSLRKIAATMTAEGDPISHETARRLIAAEADERVAPLATAYRQMQLDRLNELRERVLEIREATHLTVSNGRVVMLESEDGVKVPLPDDAPVLASVDRLLRIEERIARLLGLDAPEKAEITSTVEQISPPVLDLIERAEAAAQADVDAVQGGAD